MSISKSDIKFVFTEIRKFSKEDTTTCFALPLLPTPLSLPCPLMYGQFAVRSLCTFVQFPFLFCCPVFLGGALRHFFLFSMCLLHAVFFVFYMFGYGYLDPPLQVFPVVKCCWGCFLGTVLSLVDLIFFVLLHQCADDSVVPVCSFLMFTIMLGRST